MIFLKILQNLKIQKKALDLLEKIQKFQGILCDSSDNLYNCYSLDEKALQNFEKLYAYGMLMYHSDMANQDGIKMYKEVEALSTKFSVATAFITPEITYADETKIREYIKEERF